MDRSKNRSPTPSVATLQTNDTRRKHLPDATDELLPAFGARAYFFDSGLRFECQRCGHCCSGAPGTVYVSAAEAAAIADHLGINLERLRIKYLYPFRDSYSIRETDDGRCRFYGDGCRIYAVRPQQCRSYPFWLDNLRSERHWRTAMRACPGIGRGACIPKTQILAIVRTTF